MLSSSPGAVLAHPGVITDSRLAAPPSCARSPRAQDSPVYAESGLPASWRHMCSGSSASCKETRELYPAVASCSACSAFLLFLFFFFLFFVSELLLCLVTCHPAAAAPGMGHAEPGAAPNPLPAQSRVPRRAPEAAPSSCRDLGALCTSFTPVQEPSPMSPWHGS